MTYIGFYKKPSMDLCNFKCEKLIRTQTLLIWYKIDVSMWGGWGVVCMFVYTCRYVYICMHVCIYIYACVCVCMYICMSVCMYVCVYMCMND